MLLETFWSLDRWGRTMGELVLEIEEFAFFAVGFFQIRGWFVLNSLEFDCLLASGSVEDLKRELQLLRSDLSELSRKENKIVVKQKAIVEALARRQEACLK
jgi:hypothetical protein